MKTRNYRIIVLGVLLVVTGVLTARAMLGSSFKPFYIYHDKNSKNHFTPSGYMPDGRCVAIDDAWRYNVKNGRTCMRIRFDAECSSDRQKWAGVYWQDPPNNWGSVKGGFDLRGAQKLVFWARSEKGGERIVEFKVGGIGPDQMYPDSASASLKDVMLTREWKEYAIDLRGKDLSHISGGFAWSTNMEVNPQGCVFYIDEVRFE